MLFYKYSKINQSFKIQKLVMPKSTTEETVARAIHLNGSLRVRHLNFEPGK